VHLEFWTNESRFSFRSLEAAVVLLKVAADSCNNSKSQQSQSIVTASSSTVITQKALYLQCSSGKEENRYKDSKRS